MLITYLISILDMSVVQTLQQRFLDPPILAKIQYIFFIYTSIFEHPHIFVFTIINSFSTLKTIYVIYYIKIK